VRSVTVSELGFLSCGEISGRLIVLRAAFDASMDRPCGVTAVGGYLANLDQWQVIEERWKNQRVIAHIESFHLNDIRRRFGFGWLDVVNPFALIMREANVRSITSCMRDTDWNRLEHDPDYLEICRSPVHACLDLLFGALADD